MTAKEQFLAELVQRAIVEQGAIVFAPGDIARALGAPAAALRPTEPIR